MTTPTWNAARECPSAAGVALREVDVVHWRAVVGELAGAGGTFLGLHATQGGGEQQLRAAFAAGEEVRIVACRPTRETAPSIRDIVPAAGWDEREATDLAGVALEGQRHRALVAHPEQPDAWITPVRGHDTHQVAVGPIHAGIIESGHFRFHVVGERVLHLDLRMFYKHRGLERAAEGLALGEGIAVARRACGACAVANSVAYARACEQAQGQVAGDDVARARTTLIELERLYNHLNDIGAACAGVGFAPGSMAFAGLKERAHRLNSRLAGHRFLFDTVGVGKSGIEVGVAAARDARNELRQIGDEAARAWREVLFNGSVQNRMVGVGVLSPGDVDRLGVVGPAARASGRMTDERTGARGLAYGSFEPASLAEPAGDVRARVELRAVELIATIDLLDELLAGGLRAGACEPDAAGGDTGASTVESPRGRTFCTIEHDGGRLRRVRLRTASYANWPAVALAAVDELLPEFPLINKSFELCYACSDR